LYSTVNLVGFLLQMFVVARVIKWFGVGVALAIHPVVAFGGYLMMLRAPSLQLLGWVKVADNSLDYSLSNTTRQVLWLATSREAKYKAKQAIDSFGVRAGDVASAGLVFAGEQLALSVPAFAAITLALTGAWLTVVRLLASSRAGRLALADSTEGPP
jgi:AAA family ATP:ADP antiporter